MSAEDPPPSQPEELGDIRRGIHVEFELDQTPPASAADANSQEL